MRSQKILLVPFIQGIYFFITAVWPIVDIGSFMEVTGPKTDLWLVKTVSVLLIPYTLICFWITFSQRSMSNLLIMVMVLGGFGLALIEIIYYSNGTIRWVYGADAILQVLFAVWWISRLKKRPILE